jgi:hypothetical protein
MGVGSQLTVLPVSNAVLLLLVVSVSLPGKEYASISTVYQKNSASGEFEGTAMPFELKEKP